MTKGTRSGWRVSITPRRLFTPGKDPVPILQETGWAPESVWTGAEYLAPTGIRSPDPPARSQSLYLLSYSTHFHIFPTVMKWFLWHSLKYHEALWHNYVFDSKFLVTDVDCRLVKETFNTATWLPVWERIIKTLQYLLSYGFRIITTKTQY